MAGGKREDSSLPYWRLLTWEDGGRLAVRRVSCVIGLGIIFDILVLNLKS